MPVRRWGCGSCNLCCKLVGVDDDAFKKPPNHWCVHAQRPHGGCAIHAEKPEACAVFECLWLASQRRIADNDVMPRNLRPNNCYVVLGPFDIEDPTKLYVHVDPEHPNAWRNPDIHAYIETFRLKGATLEIVIGQQSIVLEPLESMPDMPAIEDIQLCPDSQ